MRCVRFNRLLSTNARLTWSTSSLDPETAGLPRPVNLETLSNRLLYLVNDGLDSYEFADSAHVLECIPNFFNQRTVSKLGIESLRIGA